jgi:peroxiredoxin
MWSRLGLALATAVVGAALAFLLIRSQPARDPVGAGSPAPGWSLPRVPGGEPLSLDDVRGRVVLLNFWATWCKPCEEEMPAMERLYGALRGGGFELVAISVDEEADTVDEFRRRLGLSFPILHDPEKRVSTQYHSYRFPESYLIDGSGKIVTRYIGPRDWDDPAYADRIRKLLGPPS